MAGTAKSSLPSSRTRFISVSSTLLSGERGASVVKLQFQQLSSCAARQEEYAGLEGLRSAAYADEPVLPNEADPAKPCLLGSWQQQLRERRVCRSKTGLIRR